MFIIVNITNITACIPPSNISKYKCNGIGIGNATGKAVEGVARNPEASGKITTTLVIGSAFAEATAIYGLLVSILLIFVGVA